jgi:flavin-dependent dehydrogenase
MRICRKKNDGNKNKRKRNNMKNITTEVLHPNRDPITGALGAHPVGTGIGAVAGGAAVGAAIGTVAGPVGTGIGMAVGAIAGGLAGKGIAEKIDPTAEDAYWRTSYISRSYVDKDTPYDLYQSAYRTGYEGYGRYPGKSYEEVETDLRKDYEKTRRTSGLDWNKAKHATRDAWLRVDDRQKQNA